MFQLFHLYNSFCFVRTHILLSFINTNIKEMYDFSIDILSKIYITAGWLIGINRLSVAFKIKSRYNIMSLCCSFLLNSVLGYCILILGINQLISIVRIVNLIQYFICSFFAIKSCRVLKKFYNELFEFDKEIKYQLPTTLLSRFFCGLIIVMLSVIIGVIIIISQSSKTKIHELIVFSIIDFNNIMECFYIGHLFSLLEVRLKSIRILLLSSFPYKNHKHFSTENVNINFKDKNVSKILNRNPEVEIRQLLLLYYRLIKAYDFLYTSIKWQLFSSLISSFLTILNTLHFTIIHISQIEYNNFQDKLPGVGLIMIRAIPLLVPCFFGSKICNEVALLHSALFTRAHQNVFDVTSRSSANLFLDLIQARTLTFSVFRMIEINTTLPFKFIGLLATYFLIIMQFEKVLNFDTHR
nr:gustatory receptor 18 [Papilio xuthus]